MYKGTHYIKNVLNFIFHRASLLTVKPIASDSLFFNSDKILVNLFIFTLRLFILKAANSILSSQPLGYKDARIVLTFKIISVAQKKKRTI